MASCAAAGRRWYAVRCHPRSETVAARNLARQGYQAYLPYRIRTVRHARSVRTVKDAYFPQYLFVAMDLRQDRSGPVEATHGVAQLLRAGARPAALRDGLVEALISVTARDGCLRPGELLRPGQKVRILQGPFAERIAMLDRISGRDAVEVLLSMMSRQVRVEVPRAALRPVS